MIDYLKKRIKNRILPLRTVELQTRTMSAADARDKNHLNALMLLSELNGDMSPGQLKEWDKQRLTLLSETIA